MPYRSRAVLDPRGVLAEFGLNVPTSKEIRVWDSTAEIRYLVIPQRPSGTQGWTVEQLARISHTNKCIGAPNQRKFFCEKDFSKIRGRPDDGRL